MGSLMAGWQSNISDPKTVTYQRNRSFTKDEINAYWRSRKRTEEEHLREILSSPESNQESTGQESAGVLERSRSLSLPDRKGNFLTIDSETALGDLITKNGWWTRSNSAFLNEPPVVEGEGPSHSHKYTSQFHVPE